MAPRTLFEKVWDAHIVRPETADTPAVLATSAMLGCFAGRSVVPVMTLLFLPPVGDAVSIPLLLQMISAT